MEGTGILRYFYLVGFANALFFSILIFSKPKRSRADKLLAGWLIFLSLQLVIPFLYLSDLSKYYPFAGIEAIFYVIHPLMLYLYIKSIIGQFPTRKQLFKLITFALLAELTMFSFFLIPANDRYKIIMGEMPIKGYLYVIIIPVVIYFSYFIIRSFKILKDYKQNVLEVYSYKENVDLLWLRRLALFFYGSFIVCVPVLILFYLKKVPLAEADYVCFACLTIFIFFIGFWGYKQGEVFNLHEEVTGRNSSTTTENHTTSLHPIPEDKIIAVKKIMESDKPFLNPSLTVYELAKIVDMQPHYLSRLINQEYQCNFFEFINQYRINAFKEYIASDKFKGFTLLGIALECGFNSKSAFNRIFKEHTGLTPTEYKKKIAS